MNDWVPVSQILGNIPAPLVNSDGIAVAPALEPQLVPLPPNLHWSIVLILDAVTRQLFQHGVGTNPGQLGAKAYQRQ